MSISDFILKYVVLIFVYTVLAVMIGQNGITNSFVTLSITCFITTIVAALLFLRNSYYRNVFVFAFVVKLLIGFAHYLFFYDSEFFKGNGNILQLQNDFVGYYYYITHLIEEKNAISFMYFDEEDITTHQPLMNFIATCLMNFRNTAINIVPINTLFGGLAALNIFLLARKVGLKEDRLKLLFGFLLFFPLFLDNAIYVRDIVGQFLITVGAAFILLPKQSAIRYLLLLPAAYLFGMQRDAYFFIAFVFFIYVNSFQGKKVSKLTLILSTIFVLLLFSYSMFLGGGAEAEMEKRDGQMSTITSMALWVFPLRFVFGLIGPFPWTQISMCVFKPVVSSQIYHYLVGILHLSLLFLAFSKSFHLRLWAKNPLTVLGLSFMILAYLTTALHITYIMAGTIFLLPAFINECRLRDFKNKLGLSFFLLLILNIMAFAVGGFGFKSLWT